MVQGYKGFKIEVDLEICFILCQIIKKIDLSKLNSDCRRQLKIPQNRDNIHVNMAPSRMKDICHVL